MIILDGILDFIEDCKENEYVAYIREEHMYYRMMFTKKQLLKHLIDNPTEDIKVYKIKDELKVHRSIMIEEGEQQW